MPKSCIHGISDEAIKCESQQFPYCGDTTDALISLKLLGFKLIAQPIELAPKSAFLIAQIDELIGYAMSTIAHK